MTASPGLLHMDQPLRAIYQFLLDLLVFTIKSVYYVLESIYYSLLPQRFRKLKVQRKCAYILVFNLIDFLCPIESSGLHNTMSMDTHKKYTYNFLKQLPVSHSKSIIGRATLKPSLLFFFCFILQTVSFGHFTNLNEPRAVWR